MPETEFMFLPNGICTFLKRKISGPNDVTVCIQVGHAVSLHAPRTVYTGGFNSVTALHAVSGTNADDLCAQ